MNVSVSTIVNDMHSYEPADGHGLKHDPFNAIIAPRPIGWMSTMGARGNLNLAPYSFFNAFNYKPPILAFSSTGWKDTVRNIEETREFVWNLATMPLAQAMNTTSAGVPPDVSEFETAGLTPVPSKLVKVPRVGEARAAMELKLIKIMQLETKEGRKVENWMILGEVVAVHIDKSLIVDGVYMTALAHPIARAGRKGDYFEATPDRMFDMPRPD
ncbi:flavin reductase family protein [Afipia sp. P52-10]|uniref:flavin reductase family protein n=1 Tax=Afipia sp. P52-10 TaxID=1429916 RepID=UPI0004B52B25|nr:flavin reductase family protein [Afipia sp. P52-10]